MGLVAKCHHYSAETELFYGGVPTCPKCAQALAEKQKADTRKPATNESAIRTLDEINRNLTAARDAYQQAGLATERYEKALKEFIDFRPPSRGAAS